MFVIENHQLRRSMTDLLRRGRPSFTCKDAHPTDLAVGMRIREAREAAGITQTDLAKRLGIHRQQVARYEQGVSRVTRERLQQIAAETGQPFAFFGAPLDREDSELVRLIRSLPTAHRAIVKRFVVSLGEAL